MASIDPKMTRVNLGYVPGFSGLKTEFRPAQAVPEQPQDQITLNLAPQPAPGPVSLPASPAEPPLQTEPPSQPRPAVNSLRLAAEQNGLTISDSGSLVFLTATPPTPAPLTDNRLSSWLNTRARPVFSAQELDSAAAEFGSLVKLFQDKPDPQRWNQATWGAFQLASSQTPQQLMKTAEAIEKGQPLEATALQWSLADPQVDRQTLVGMLRVRSFASQIVEAELPTLLPSERKKYLQHIHDHGYAQQQVQRTQDPSSILCGGPGQELLSPQQLSCLPPQLAARFAPEARLAPDLNVAFPKLTLAEFFQGQPAQDHQARNQALEFLQASGKEVDRPSKELGGKSMRQFLQPEGRESRSEYVKRLEGKQVFNSLARPWSELQNDLTQLQAQGAEANSLESQLQAKQTPALAPTLLLLNAPSLYEQAARQDNQQVSQSIDGLMQVFFRATNPHLNFSDPLISQGLGQLKESHQEHLAKDRQLWTSVVNLQKTAVVAGLSDQKYELRTAFAPKLDLPQEENDEVTRALGRLQRDLGSDSRSYTNITEGINYQLSAPDLVNQLHALRFNPKSFAVPMQPGQTHFTLGDQVFKVSPQDGQFVPEFVGATSICYRVENSAGESSILRLPKGARPEFDENHRLQLKVHDRERFQEVSARMIDFEHMDTRVKLTDRSLLQSQQGYVVLENRAHRMDAGQSLQAGGKLRKQDAEALLDQWLAGQAEVDPVNRPFGVLYELGPDNYVLGKDGIEGSYVDVALAFRTERERSLYGFVNGGYGSASNWVVADNHPLSQEQIQSIWKGEGLSPAQSERRELFVQAMSERLKPDHPVWQTFPPEQRAPMQAAFREDLSKIGLCKD
ncbi:hypothetical protein JST97_15235 [bacterium]|nr:hypothetical protein [bacterium]